MSVFVGLRGWPFESVVKVVYVVTAPTPNVLPSAISTNSDDERRIEFAPEGSDEFTEQRDSSAIRSDLSSTR